MDYTVCTSPVIYSSCMVVQWVPLMLTARLLLLLLLPPPPPLLLLLHHGRLRVVPPQGFDGVAAKDMEDQGEEEGTTR